MFGSIFEWVQFDVDEEDYWACYSIQIVIVDSNDCVQF